MMESQNVRILIMLRNKPKESVSTVGNKNTALRCSCACPGALRCKKALTRLDRMRRGLTNVFVASRFLFSLLLTWG